MEWLDIWKTEPIRNEEILFMTGDEGVHIGEIFSEEKLRKCKFYSFNDKCYFECDSKTPFDERVIYWHPLPQLPKNTPQSEEYCSVCKNEYVACVCISSDKEH